MSDIMKEWDDAVIEETEETSDNADIVANTINNQKFATITKKLMKYSKDSENRERFVFERPSLARCIVPILAGFLFSVGFIYFLIIALGTFLYSAEYRRYAGYGLLIIAAIFLVNVVVIRRAIKEIRYYRRYDHYYNILRYRKIAIVDDLAHMLDVEHKIAEKDLNRAVKEKLIPQGHFGREKVIFMVSDEVFEKYSARRAIYDRYFKKLIEERNRMKERTKETAELLEQGEEYIGKIRDCNEIIKDKGISAKLDRMEKVVSAIFHEVDVDPSQSKKLGVFIEYYLPTTEKLLETYIEIDEKKVKGESALKTQKDISRTLDSINSAFEGLLERFYQEQERNITSEIFAMETVMKQEGLNTDGE